MTYNKEELEALWAAENPGNGNPHLMAAIALAESAGNEKVVNSIGACGLWQIHPFEAGCENARTNAKMAGRKLSSQGLGAWETYTNGAYKKYYTGPVTDNASLLSGIGKNPFESLQNPGKALGEDLSSGAGGILSLGKIPGDFDKIYKLLFTPEGWVRIGKVLVGLFLLLTGVLGMANVSAPDPATILSSGKSARDLAVAAGVL